MKKENGITLIALIITIIVLLILAVVSISLVMNGGLIGRTEESVFKSEIEQYNEELKLAVAEDEVINLGFRTSKFNIRRSGYDNEETFTDAMKTKIPSFNKKYANKLEIKEDALTYIGEDEKEREWLAQTISLAGMLKIAYKYEDGTEAAPTYQKVITDGSYEVESPKIEGYEPDHYIVEGISNKDTDVTVTYYGESQGLEYELLDDGTYTVAGIGTFTGENLVIPREYNGKAVTQIKSSAFKSNITICKLIISDTIINVGETAFGFSSRLNEIYINSKIIGSTMFRDCYNLKKIVIGSNVESIQARAFESDNKLEDFMILSEYASLFSNNTTFNRCSSLKELKVNNENNTYKVIDGILFSKNGTKLVRYPVAKENTEYTIPSEVTEIGYGAFVYDLKLEKVNIPSSVINVGQVAFGYCSKLKEIYINSKVIGNEMFRDCQNLQKVVIGNNVESIQGRAFESDNKLEDVMILSEYASLFSNSTTFDRCSSLKELKVNNENNTYKVIDGILFSKDGTKLIRYPVAKENTQYTIPSEVTEIEYGAFTYNMKLEKINILSNVISVGQVAFGYCSKLNEIYINSKNISYVMLRDCLNLQKVVIGSNVETIQGRAFENDSNISELEFEETKEKWNAISKEKNWNNKFNITQVICSDGTIDI